MSTGNRLISRRNTRPYVVDEATIRARHATSDAAEYTLYVRSPANLVVAAVLRRPEGLDVADAVLLEALLHPGDLALQVGDGGPARGRCAGRVCREAG